MIPILQLPEDGSLHVDSTPLAYMLEGRHAERSIIPSDPAVAYLSDLIEDMGDEWCTKVMFHYRWYREVDRFDWLRRLEDSSGIDGEWHSFDQLRPATVELLRFTARYYLPFLAANADAFAKNTDVNVALEGQMFSQQPYKYQLKCYDRLKKLLATRPEQHLRDLLEETGCLRYLA